MMPSLTSQARSKDGTSGLLARHLCRVHLTLVLLMIFQHFGGLASAQSDTFVFPGNSIPEDRPVWGHRDGLRIGLAPTPGPRGLIRIYAPYLGQEFPRMVNFISIEPLVEGDLERGQSELEPSRHRLRETGLSFYPSENPDNHPESGTSPKGLIDLKKGTLRLFIHPEPFTNGARPVIETIFHRNRPHSVEFRTHAHPDSAPLAECVLSATMGNYGLLREVGLINRVATTAHLWPPPQTPLDALGFLPWITFSPDQLRRDSEGWYVAEAKSDLTDPAAAPYPDTTPKSWRYQGLPARHVWSTPHPATLAVNARTTYWSTRATIPGAPSIENFELRAPFEAGQRFRFSIKPLSTDTP